MRPTTSPSFYYKALFNLIKLLPMYLLFLAISFFIGMEIHMKFSPIGYFLYAFGIAYTYGIRYKINKHIPYLICHAFLFPILLCFSTSSFMIGLSLLFCLLFYIYAYQYWHSNEIKAIIVMPAPFVIACYLFYLVSLVQRNNQYMVIFTILSILYVLSSILSGYIIRIEAYLIENQENDSISLSQVLWRNTQLGIFLLCIFVFFALISTIPAIQHIAWLIYHTITSFLKHMLQSIIGQRNSNIMLPTKVPMPTQIHEKLIIRRAKTSLFANILHNILVTIGICLIAYIVGYLIWKLIRGFLLGGDKRKSRKFEKEYDGITETRTKLKSEKKTVKKNTRRMNTYEKKREEYRKAILAYQKEGYVIKENQSPFERKNEIEQEFHEDIHDLTKEYEAVRYNKMET